MPRGYGTDAGGYVYAPPPPTQHHDARYEHHPYTHAHPPHSQSYHGARYIPYPTSVSTPSSAGAAMPAAGVEIILTDDAATRVTDRVRRRCFNCCTTDTSTWRRSNLSPGKVLCNKCGLFERTHARPRPEQFPHKRGPLSSSALRSPPRQPVVAGSSAGTSSHGTRTPPSNISSGQASGAASPRPEAWKHVNDSSSGSRPVQEDGNRYAERAPALAHRDEESMTRERKPEAA